MTPTFTAGAKAPETSRTIPRPLLFGVLAYLAIYASWLAFHWGGRGNEAAIGDLVFVPLTLLTIGVAWTAARRCAAEPRIASAWRLIGLALVFYCIGDMIQFAYETAGSFPAPSLADPFYLLFYPLFFAGLMHFPMARGTRHERARLLLDATTIAIGAGSVIWYVVLGPTATESTSSLFTSVVASAYPVGDIVLIVGLTHVLLRAQTRGARRALSLLAGGIALYVIADLVYGWLTLHSSYSGGSELDALWMTATALFALAASSQATPSANSRSAELDGTLVRADSPRLSALPYIAVAAVFGLLIETQVGDSIFPGLSLTLTAVLIGALVSVRHYISQRDLLAVHRELGTAHAELAALATTDALTALPNHRALVSAIDLELARAERYEHGCALLFLDIDHFKELNDSCGHAAGDLALRELGTLVNKTLRSIDTLGRWGGEEFVVVLPEIDAERAMAIAERVRKTIAAHLFEVATGTHLTVSVGIAAYPRDGTTRGELLDAADRAMYAAKWLGRNQTFNADDAVAKSIDRSDGAMSIPDERAMMGAVDALALLVDARDKDTSEHSLHVAKMSKRVALALGFTTEHARRVYLAAKLHDIGKVAVADAILRKTEPLTPAEWEAMCRHPTIGADVVGRIARLADLAPIIRAHQERYDGSGYPEGLAGEQIPLEARIVGVADAFDAMVSDRPYRKRMTVDEARAELHRCAGTQFDPTVVAAVDSVLGLEAVARATA
jgi:diguanylate cyclase (GGDEF)-like protein